jgi:hypothetical protein
MQPASDDAGPQPEHPGTDYPLWEVTLTPRDSASAVCVAD